MTSQIRRAATSIPANIAEGASRGGDREFQQFIYVARGSLAELQTFLLLARDIGYLDGDVHARLKEQSEGLARALNSFLAAIKNRPVGSRNPGKKSALVLGSMLLSVAVGFPLLSFAGSLTPKGVSVTDLSGAPRTDFTSTEQLTFVQTVYVSSPGSTPVAFSFKVLNPSGAQVFLHTGNSAPGGAVGQASTRISGIPISRLYTLPGRYTMIAEASIDGGPPVVQQAFFTVTTPVLTLLYPPDGIRGLEDRPLMFHWTGSGASRFRIQVCDNASFYNVLLTGETGGSETSFIYPENPKDTRQRLAGGQVYYWKVLGLDASGNAVSQSGTNSFSLKGSAVGLTRDMAVVSLDVGPPMAGARQGAIPFKILVKNQGGTTESNVLLRFTLGGLAPPESPRRLPVMGPGDEHTATMPAKVPSDQEMSLAVACLDLFDDSILNNCKTLLVASPKQAPLDTSATGQALAEGLAAGATTQTETQAQEPEEAMARAEAAAAWDSVKTAADPKVQKELKDYQAQSIAGEGLSPAQAQKLLDDVKAGKAKIIEMTVE